MEKLRWLEIENYRGIKQVKLKEFGDLNIIIGKNNTGKSTILESIYLNITSQNLDLVGNYPLIFIFKRRGASLSIPFPRGNLDAEDLFHYLSYIFYNESFEKSIKFVSNLGKYQLDVIKDDFPNNIIKFVVDYISRRRFPKVDIGEILYVVVDNFQRPLIVAFEGIRKNDIEYYIKFIFHYPHYIKKQKRKNIILIDTHWLFHYYKFDEPPVKAALMRLERYSRLDKQKLTEFLSEQLGHRVSAVESRLFDIYIITKNNKYIPFSLLGDGTKTFLIYFYTLSLENSYILFEEPENHLHPKLMKHCIDLMVESASKNQIFITTHNIEVLQMILKKAKEANINLKVYSINAVKNGIPEYETYNLNEAYTAVNKIGVDLR